MGQGAVACMRYILCAFTLIFVIFGILLLYTGFSTFISLHQYSLVISNPPDTATIILLVLGFVIFLISFLGCCGAITGNDFMLRTFAFILTLLLLIEILSIVSVFAFKKTIRQSLESGLEESIRKYNATDDSATTKFINQIQTQFSCCGANSVMDWQNNTVFNNTDLLPKSCCLRKENVEESCNVSGQHFVQGCIPIIIQELKNAVSYLGSITITVIVLEIIGLAFSCILSGQRRKYDYV